VQQTGVSMMMRYKTPKAKKIKHVYEYLPSPLPLLP
jgi:hypothetical protein